MAGLGLYLLLLFCFQYTSYIVKSTVVTNPDPSATNFIRASCQTTRYPVLCFQLLSGYAGKIQQNRQELAQAALSISLAKAQLTSVFVSKLTRAAGIEPRQRQALKDCRDNMVNTVDQLNRSIKEFELMHQLKVQEFTSHMSNVQTWVSAALTYENTCLDSFSGQLMEGNLKAAVKGRITSVAQVTSNALALVNQFAQRRGATTAAATDVP